MRGNDVILLSPASASFDVQNFEERGNAFKKIVNELACSIEA